MKNRTLADATGPTDGRDGGNVVWVYAVTAEVGTDELSGVTGVAGEPVRAVTDAGLSAVVGTVGDIGHGDKPLTRLLVGLTAIETAGRAHRTPSCRSSWPRFTRTTRRSAGNSPSGTPSSR
jgi:hypothetical protein